MKASRRQTSCAGGRGGGDLGRRFLFVGLVLSSLVCCSACDKAPSAASFSPATRVTAQPVARLPNKAAAGISQLEKARHAEAPQAEQTGEAPSRKTKDGVEARGSSGRREGGQQRKRGMSTSDDYALPRGVNPRLAGAYKPIFSPPAESSFAYPLAQLARGEEEVSSAFFKCPSTGALIPWAMINDNFCDCRGDGFDEPGTDACSGVAPVHSAAAMRFRAALQAFLAEEDAGGRPAESDATSQAQTGPCRWPGGCAGKEFRRLKGASGFFCASQDGSGASTGKPRVISPMKVHDGVCDCCDGSDEAADVSLLPVRAVGYRPFAAFFPFETSPQRAGPSAACANRCEEEAAAWEASRREASATVEAVRAQVAAQEQQVAQLLRQKAEEAAALETAIRRLEDALNCQWLERQWRHADAGKGAAPAHVHHNAAFQLAVKREIVAAREGPRGQAQKVKELAAQSADEELRGWCEALLKDVRQDARRGVQRETGAEAEAEQEEEDGDLGVEAGLAAEVGAPPPATFSRPEKLALFPPPRPQYELLGQAQRAAKEAARGAQTTTRAVETRTAALAAKAAEARRAALEAYLQQQRRGAGEKGGKESEESEDEEEAKSARGSAVGAVLDSLWQSAAGAARRGVQAVHDGLAWMGLAPQPKKEKRGSLHRSLEELKEKKKRLSAQLRHAEGVKGLLAPLYSTCLFTFDLRRRFDYQLCLFDSVRQFPYRPRRAQEALAAYQASAAREGERLPDTARFTGGAAKEPSFLLGTFDSLELVRCPRGSAAARRLLQTAPRGLQASAKARAVQSRTDAATAAAEGAAGISFRPEGEKKGAEEEEEDSLGDDGDPGDHQLCFSMLFLDGDSCADDVQRETEALIHCGPELAVVQVSEVAPCRYAIVLTTPLLCPREQLLEQEKKQFKVLHDEL
ncbi:hypothetical protein BESB_013460 [Besnoitia besnoiti]|uniref:Glucosidase 2 subunit beta-like domain-containing protein n=1 Tax=Besnoitia besnoiti TaxID=94643 RepID=A0A2A9M6C4_BESBE|nr:hypothetical protein BESB_013460 [Besnoitia besnoiti]PFH32734.1 hypothetical protein BESB_013460 [Besnoitia besnoiti]